MLSITQLKNFSPLKEPCGIPDLLLPDLLLKDPEYKLFKQIEPDSFENQENKLLIKHSGKPFFNKANSKPKWLTRSKALHKLIDATYILLPPSLKN